VISPNGDKTLSPNERWWHDPASALASGATQFAARCSTTGAARLPDPSRSRDSSAPAPAVPAATAVTAVIRAPRVTVSSAGLLPGRVPGLLTAPTGGLWVAERLAWLPVFAIMLSGLWLAFHRVETPS
jgi:hypothetical protein